MGFCLAGAVFGFATIPIVLRYFSSTLDAWTVNGVRYSVGALFWLPFLLLLDRSPVSTGRVLSKSKPHGIWIDAIVPSLANVVAQASFGLAPYYVSASAIGFVLRLSFLFTVVFGLLILAEERLLARKRAFWGGAITSLVGVAAMYYDKLDGTGGLSLGMMFVLGAAIGTGAYTVSVRYFMSHYSTRQSFGVISLYTSAALVALMLCCGDYGRLWQISLGLWCLLAISALIGIAFGHVLLYQAIQQFGPVVASGVQLVTPFITYLIAAICLGERLTSTEWGGGILLIVGGALLVMARLQVEEGLDERPSPSSFTKPQAAGELATLPDAKKPTHERILPAGCGGLESQSVPLSRAEAS